MNLGNGKDNSKEGLASDMNVNLRLILKKQSSKKKVKPLKSTNSKNTEQITKNGHSGRLEKIYSLRVSNPGPSKQESGTLPLG